MSLVATRSPEMSAWVTSSSSAPAAENPRFDGRRRHGHHAAIRRRLERLGEARRHVGAGQHLDHALGRTVALGEHHHRPARASGRLARRRGRLRCPCGTACPRPARRRSCRGRRRAASSSSTPNDDVDHHGSPSSEACSRMSASERYEASARSIGAVPPSAATSHDACRNSRLVASRSWARVRTRSGSHTSTMASSVENVEHRLHAVGEQGRQRLHAVDGHALVSCRRIVGRAQDARRARPARAHVPTR